MSNQQSSGIALRDVNGVLFFFPWSRVAVPVWSPLRKTTDEEVPTVQIMSDLPALTTSDRSDVAGPFSVVIQGDDAIRFTVGYLSVLESRGESAAELRRMLAEDHWDLPELRVPDVSAEMIDELARINPCAAFVATLCGRDDLPPQVREDAQVMLGRELADRP